MMSTAKAWETLMTKHKLNFKVFRGKVPKFQWRNNSVIRL